MHRREVVYGAASLPLLAALGTARAAAADPPATPAPDISTAGTPPSVTAPPGTPFDDNTVPAMAQQLAAQPYKPPDSSLPKELQNLNYSQYQTIRFKPDQALWRGQGTNFTAEFFHRGYLYKDRVDIFQVVNGRAIPIAYRSGSVHLDQGQTPAREYRLRRVPLALSAEPAGLFR